GPPCHLDRRPGLVGENEYRRVERGIIAPPSPPFRLGGSAGERFDLVRPMLSAPMTGSQFLAKESSTPLLPPRSPCIWWKVRVGKIGTAPERPRRGSRALIPDRQFEDAFQPAQNAANAVDLVDDRAGDLLLTKAHIARQFSRRSPWP